MKFQNIVLLQGHEADEPLRILDDHGTAAAVAYLAQWDTPQLTTDLTDFLRSGMSDQVAYADPYVLVYNFRLNYIGLEKMIGGDA